MKSGNTKLVQYGIYEEEVDLRIHVGFMVKKLFIYEREKAIEVLKWHPVKPAFQKVNGEWIETAKGHLVPVGYSLFGIIGLINIEIPNDILERHRCVESSDESMKGEKALDVVREMLQKGTIQLYMPDHFKVSAKHEGDLDMQLKGKDIILIQEFPSIQVKCDYKAGKKSEGGTGNLFVQTHECNPLGKH